MAIRASAYARLPTERPNPATRDIDRRSTLGVVRLINSQDAGVARAVGRQAAQIAKAVEAIAASLRAGGRVLFVGAGTSGRIGVLEAAECPPTFGTPPSLISAAMAGGKAAVFKSKEGAEDDAAAGERAVSKLKSGDVVIGVAASGVTAFVRAALTRARARGCVTVLVTSNGRPPGNPARILIAPAVGPEVITGSTRLKSGTAAKLVLNTLTSAVMIKLGKVYDHWMVDLKPTNRKLRLRAARIVCDLGKVSPARAEALLEKSGCSVKLAVVMARKNLDAEQAKKLLRVSGGSLREALA